jgi:hypothetical protein
VKYLNQINAVLMLVGCVVVVYAFSVTFWEQDGGISRVSELPQVGGASEATGTSGPAILRRSTTTNSAAVERVTPRRAKSAPARGAETVPAGQVRSQESSRPVAEPVVQVPEAEGPNVTRVGERREAVSVNRQTPADPSSPTATGPPPGSRSRAESIVPRREPPRPADTAQSQKRNESRSTSTPPVRSSMMGRRPQ